MLVRVLENSTQGKDKSLLPIQLQERSVSYINPLTPAQFLSF